MKITPLSQVLEREGLTPPKLNLIQANEQLYSVLAAQPKAKMLVTDRVICQADRQDAVEQMSAFLALVSEGPTQPDLVVTPEYSMPWQVLTEKIKQGLIPLEGKLWALGCESLSLDDNGTLENLRETGAIVISENLTEAARTTQQYLNPLAYVFQAQSKAGESKLVVLIQFKTRVSGDKHNTEATGMLPGERVYLFGTQPQETRLLTLICSDAFDFDSQTIENIYDGLLVLHIQLNGDPRHGQYKPYRQALYQYRGSDTEVFCLNWAADIELLEGEKQKSLKLGNIAGSAWYVRAPQFDRDDDKLKKNQEKGMYYSWYDSLKVHALNFHYAPRAFFLHSTKIKHHGVVGGASYRTGPYVSETFVWSVKEKKWFKETEKVLDGFKDIVERAAGGINLTDWETLHSENPLFVERALAICAGEFGPKKNWYTVEILDSTVMCPAEILKRSTVDLDPDARDFRTQRFSTGRALSAMREANFEWPPEVAVLRDGFTFTWSQKFPHRNVKTNGSVLATIVHAGLITDSDKLDSIDTKARRALSQPPEPEVILDEKQEKEFQKFHESQVARVCVFYSDGLKTMPFKNKKYSKFSSSNFNPVAVNNPSRVPVEPEHLKDTQ